MSTDQPMGNMTPTTNIVERRQDRDARVWAASSLAASALFFAGLLLQVVSMDRNLNLYDEGLVVYGAARVMRGEVPYRDFWSMYGPGQFYLIAGLFKIFGTQSRSKERGMRSSGQAYRC
jgi:hypothetical protein